MLHTDYMDALGTLQRQLQHTCHGHLSRSSELRLTKLLVKGSYTV